MAVAAATETMRPVSLEGSEHLYSFAEFSASYRVASSADLQGLAGRGRGHRLAVCINYQDRRTWGGWLRGCCWACVDYDLHP